MAIPLVTRASSTLLFQRKLAPPIPPTGADSDELHIKVFTDRNRRAVFVMGGTEQIFPAIGAFLLSLESLDIRSAERALQTSDDYQSF